MTILSCRTGLTAATTGSLTLFIVQKEKFDAFTAAQPDSQQLWLKARIQRKNRPITCLPDWTGRLTSACGYNRQNSTLGYRPGNKTFPQAAGIQT